MAAKPSDAKSEANDKSEANAKSEADTEVKAKPVTKSKAVELTESTAAGLPHHNFLSRLYTGTGAFEVVGRRRLWYGISGAIVAIAIVSILVRGFTFGIDFKGGTTVSMPAVGEHGTVQTTQVQDVFTKAVGRDAESVVIVGSGSSATVQIRSEHLDNAQTAKLKTALFDAFQPQVDGKPSKQAISDSAVSETWGGQITKKAVIALGIFVFLVFLYITVRYERYMAISALITMVFDLTVTAGVYALVGFEVSPATVIGLLTILGFSLYDTVIVFDKVEENTHGFQHTTRRTFAEQANLAINQTFMRSINTSLISVLPVLALMVVAVWLLGVGTLKDLALVQLVGILVGTYSSIFFATPLLVTLRERTELVRTHSRRVSRRRNPASAVKETKETKDAKETKGAKETKEPRGKAGKLTEAAADADDTTDDTTDDTDAATQVVAKPAVSSKPAPGARPVRPTGTRRPTGKRNAGRR